MKRLYFFYSFIFLLYISIPTQGQPVTDSVLMGPGYANDIFYSFSEGEVHSVSRTNWDIAFYTLTWSAGIIINEGSGVELRCYPGNDTSGWNAVDTTGLSGWNVYYNSEDNWEEGAFNRAASGHPDYGWGVYNPITHDVVGDSLYIIKLGDGTYRKLWIVKKISVQNTYVFKYAKLDGSEETMVTLNCNDYAGKNFVYYSMLTHETLDREPASGSWDILFTKYITMIGGTTPYPVTGVLNNLDIPANRFEQVAPDFDDWSALPMDSTKSPIGYDWKYFDMGSFTYKVEDSLAFFVRNSNKDVYKLVFTAFDFMTGKSLFEKNMVHTSGMADPKINSLLAVYPNPASDFIRVNPQEGFAGGTITLTDGTGRVVYRNSLDRNEQQIEVGQLNAGLYLLTVSSMQGTSVQKILIR